MLAASTGLLTAGAGSAGATDGFRYVALGDSYASGSGLGSPTNVSCHRSSRNYPSWIAATYKATEFKDVSCSGATTRSLWNHQGDNPPQVNALTADTDLVTVSLGGNDLGFSDVLTKCVIAGLSDREGSPCRDQLNSTGYDQLEVGVALLTPRISSMLVDIKRRSPNARVVVVGYPDLLPATGAGCGSSVPLAKGDVTYLDGITRKLNAMLAAEAQKKGAVYADTYSAFVGHDMCQSADTSRWINPLLPVTSGSAHPNWVGHLVMANRVYTALK